ncbi:hypothetical protein DEIGR_400064 [Deinococcus grandis]|uniref:site-specific DNA-methyltransferase (adenine-specific) n=1 Tax=Deinococcus grandis TaxID=57498 RepID=A0A100HNE0_9DEIO|nr:class I SAM-dependent DNA methyltransferase [Deinococcus grandis]GAQ23931.1 hypothetical protein DEIGR_400064 [Deinococcus grandis]
MDHAAFARFWRNEIPRAAERDSYQNHWRGLCEIVRHPFPGVDPNYKFERKVQKVGTKDTGFADVYKAKHFIAEYKRPGRDLGAARQQAALYAWELGNPPLLITSDFARIEVNTAFTGTSPKTYLIGLDDIEHNQVIKGGDLTALEILNSAFHAPENLDPRHFRERLTTTATRQVGQVALRMGQREGKARAAHMMMRLVFALFAEDVTLLERGLVTRVLERSRAHPENSQAYFQELFRAMKGGGEFWGHDIQHFNGGLFDEADALAITSDEAAALVEAAQLDWSEVEPSIFGTLFENGLDEDTRSRRGAHYTSVTDIERVVDRVVMEPLWAEWDALRHGLQKMKRQQRIEQLFAFQDRVRGVRVLDPACGSGNFLFVALKKLLDLEYQIRSAVTMNGVGEFEMPPLVHPKQMLGLEIEPFAHELASITLWMGYIQWKRAHGGHWETPILQHLNNIQNRDALLNPDGTEAQWPDAEFIVGNPPFLGDKMMRAQLGGEYTNTLRGVYADRLPAQSDLVCYWPEKARAMVESGVTRRAGFVATNSIRGGKNRVVLDRIKATGDIFMAWPDEPWEQNGAAVRVSLFAFDKGMETQKTVNDQFVSDITADLTSRIDVKSAVKLSENGGRSFIGTQKGGAFDIPAELAQQWINAPNPDGVENADVLKPWVNGMDLTRRPSNRWIIDFALMSEMEASRYLMPMAYVVQHIQPVKSQNRRENRARHWWRFDEPASNLRAGLAGLTRFIGIPRVAKHLLPVWLPEGTLPDSQVVSIARDDDFTFGVLASTTHRCWARAQGTYMGVGNDLRYTPSTCFETFPFPDPAPEQRADIEKWARFVVTMREHLLAQDTKATLTGLYNDVVRLRAEPDATHPVTALVKAHADLDKAVAAAYGWDWPLSEDDVLARLLALNLERAATA